MKKTYKFFAAFLFFCMICTTCKIRGTAAEERTYTVALYAGNHGRFMDTSFVSVANDRTQAAVGIEEDGSVIKVNGLKKGEIVVFDAASEGAVGMEDDSKYYIKGIRRSGRDNSEVDTSAVLADADRDYVIAYAVRGAMVSYEVRYEDQAGRALAQSRIYYGNVGDRPVPAFIYISGYVPQAYNLTKTLSQKAEENVFTFVYSRLSSPGQGGGGSHETDGGNRNTGEDLGEAAENAAETAVQEVQGTQTAVPGDFTELVALAEAETAAAQEEEPVAVPDTDTPREIVGLNDEDVPRAERENKIRDTASIENLMVAALAIPVLFIAYLILWLKRSRRKKDDDE